MPLALAATSVAQCYHADERDSSSQEATPRPSSRHSSTRHTSARHASRRDSGAPSSAAPPSSSLRDGLPLALHSLDASDPLRTPASSLTETPRSARRNKGFFGGLVEGGHHRARVLSEEILSKQMADGAPSIHNMLSDAQVPWYIILPTYTWKNKWDIFILGLVMVTSFTVPLDLAYRELELPRPIIDFIDGLDVAMLVFFVIDFFLSFFVSDNNADGEWLATLQGTSYAYMRTWLVIDLLAIIPFEQVAGSDAGALRLFKVLRLLRLGKLMKSKGDAITENRAVFIRFLRMFLMVALLTHWSGCLLRAVSPRDDPSTYSQPSLYIGDMYASLCLLLGESLIYIPPNIGVTIISMATMLIGALVVAALFGNVAMLVASFNISRTRLQEKMDQVNETMKSARLPKELQASVRQYYIYSWMRHKAMNSRTFIDELSPGLRSKTSLYLYQDMLAAVPLFSHAPIAVLEALALCIRANVYMPSDIIIREGLIGEDMYIIGDGEVQVSLPDGQKVAVLGRGAFFGEMALLSNDQLRHSRVEALSICDIYSLRKEDMDYIFEMHPKLRQDMLEEVKKRQEQNNARFQTAIKTARCVCKFRERLFNKADGFVKALPRMSMRTSRLSVGGCPYSEPAAAPQADQEDDLAPKGRNDTTSRYSPGVYSASGLIYRTTRGNEFESSENTEDCQACGASQSSVTHVEPPLKADDAVNAELDEAESCAVNANDAAT